MGNVEFKACLKFQSLSSVLLPYKITLESLEKSEKYKGRNKISISPEITVNILVYFLLLFYICGWVYTLTQLGHVEYWVFDSDCFLPNSISWAFSYIITNWPKVSPKHGHESNNRRQPEVKGHYDFRREIMTLMPTAFALKACSLKPARVARQGLNVGWRAQRGRELEARELPSLPLCVWIPWEGAGQLCLKWVKNAKWLFIRAQLRASLSGRYGTL